MFARFRRDEADDGFTLIELLVVIIIIGILAAIAIPVFLNQRVKGYDAQAKSDLRNLATLEEDFLYSNQAYGPGAALTSVKHGSRVTLTVVAFEGTKGYCLSAVHADSGKSWFFDSTAGGLQPVTATGCPTNYATSDGVAIP